MVTVTLRETYDLATKPGKMTLIGIHTPTRNIISRLYPGLCEQFKMCKIIHQNVRLASAARLPVDPLQVGVNEEGLVSPEDMFNPILYKAVSNESLSNLEYRIRGLKSAAGTLDGESISASVDGVTKYDDEFNVYYSLLSNTHGWKVAHPQAGLTMRKLHPLVFEKWYNEGVNEVPYNVVSDTNGDLVADEVPIDTSSSVANQISHRAVESMRGRPHRMPAFNTHYLTAVRDSDAAAVGNGVKNGFADGEPANVQAFMPIIPCIYTGLILVPPSRTTKLYYRMVVETVVSFYGLQSQDEVTAFYQLNNRTMFPVYWNYYSLGGDSKDSDLKVEEDTVTASDGATVKKIMEA